MTLQHLISLLAFAALLGCYDIARRMSLRTRHGMRLAVLLIGLAAVAAMVGRHAEALALLLAGCGVYRIFDLRAEGWHVRSTACGCHRAASGSTEPARAPHEPAAPPGAAMAGGGDRTADQPTVVSRLYH